VLFHRSTPELETFMRFQTLTNLLFPWLFPLHQPVFVREVATAPRRTVRCPRATSR
jgi:hypothetical protein